MHHEPLTMEQALALGVSHHQRGALPEAEAAYRRVLELQPQNADALNNLGLIALQVGQHGVALQLLGEAARLRPGNADFLNNLGEALRRAGRPAEAVQALHAALAADPGNARAQCSMGTALQALGQLEQARGHYEEALRLAPGLAAAHLNFGCLHRDQGQVAEAQACFERALAIEPGSVEAHNNLGNALKDQGRLSDAIASYRTALRLRPDHQVAWSGLLLALIYSPDHRPAELLAESRAFAARFETPLASAILPHANARDPERRLRVGYLSPDFRRHPVARFIEPVLERHDRERFEVTCYHCLPWADEVTRRIRGLDLRWRAIAALSDAQAADAIRADGIDILVDLAGHTANNRLMLMARKPAPLQMTYLGYLGSTGLSTIDYRITDGVADAAGADAHYSERLLRLPGTMWCYRPGAGMPPVAPPPVESAGRVTFGSLCNIAKVNEGVIALWSRVLAGAPTAGLLMATIAPGAPRERLLEAFARHGVGRERIAFADWLEESRFVQLYAKVDVVLDVFPCNGATTTCEALWQGVPVVTFRGEAFPGRAGASLLGSAGMGEFVAADAGGYVDIATRLAGDPASLRRLRATLRDRLAGSPVMDEAGFTLGLEAGYRRAWREWCGRP